jgi:hypothetical protein
MKFKIIKYDCNDEYILEGIDLTEKEKECYGGLKTIRADLFCGGSFSDLRKSSDLDRKEFFEKYFKDKIVEIDSFHQYLLLANNVKIISG